MFQLFILFPFLCISLVQTTENASLAEALAVAKDFEFGAKQATELIKEVAGLDPGEIEQLGFKYFNGTDFPVDRQKAAAMFFLAAARGHGPAAIRVSSCYYLGTAVPVDLKESVRWLRVAAERNMAVGQLLLADRLRMGIGTAKDYREAFYWYGRAATLGNARAREMMSMGATPEGPPPSEAQVLAAWEERDLQQQAKVAELRAAAEGGDAGAQLYLAQVYFQGSMGVPVDRKLAIEWYQKSAAQGNAQAKEILDMLRKKPE